jgi:hypothetical protein
MAGVGSHGAVPRGTAEIHSSATVRDDLGCVETRLLEVREEPFAQHIALTGGHDRDTGLNERTEHFEIVADMIAMVMGEKNEHCIRLLAGDVAHETFLGGVLRRLRD